MESLNCPKNRRLAKNKINQYQLYELHNLLKLLFVIARSAVGIVRAAASDGRRGVRALRRTASELWGCKPMMWKRFIIYLNNAQLFFIEPSISCTWCLSVDSTLRSLILKWKSIDKWDKVMQAVFIVRLQILHLGGAGGAIYHHFGTPCFLCSSSVISN